MKATALIFEPRLQSGLYDSLPERLASNEAIIVGIAVPDGARLSSPPTPPRVRMMIVGVSLPPMGTTRALVFLELRERIQTQPAGSDLEQSLQTISLPAASY